MKISNVDNDYLKLWKRSFREVFYAFFSTNVALNVAIFTFTMRFILGVFFAFQKRKNIKIWHFRNITFTVYIII